MNGNSNENNVNQLEDLDRESRNINQLNRTTVRNLNLEDYFKCDEEIKNKGHVNKTKLQEIVRLISLNARGCSLTNDRRMN